MTVTGSAMDCKVYAEMVLGLLWTVKYTEDCICRGMESIRRTGTVYVVDCRVYGGIVLGL